MVDAGREPAVAQRHHEDVAVLDDDGFSEIWDGAQRTAHGDQAMRVAMLAPPWIPVPPPAYGGIEQVIALLAAELTERGHEITLFAAPGTESEADVLSPLEGPHPDEIQLAVYEADHVASAFARADEEDPPFDVLHDNCGFTAFAFADRIETPVLHTLHGPFTPDTSAFYARHAGKASAVALSRYQAEQAPEELEVLAVIGNPIVVDEFPFRDEKDDYLLWIGRLNDDKGPQRAIAAAREAGAPLVLAGPVQPGEEEFFAREVEPHLDGDGIRYIGEVGADKAELYAGARAFLMPIRWAEPFGLVMTEAMACGTPVIAFPEGSAPELVLDGETGFVVNDEHEMAAAVGRLGEIDPARCRDSARERFDVAAVAEAYERAYEAVSAKR
ncbi:MAG TPA: glycosyltransferase family 4 protein [Thermoleophilaceae bacterium]